MWLSTTGSSANLVTSLELPSRDECSGVLTSPHLATFSPKWIKRGVALFLALNY